MSASIPRNLMAALSYALHFELIFIHINQWCSKLLLHFTATIGWRKTYRAAAWAVSNPPIHNIQNIGRKKKTKINHKSRIAKGGAIRI